MSEGTPKILTKLINRLAIVRTRENSSSLLYGILFSASTIVGGAILALLVEQMFYLPVLPRTIIFWLIAGAAIGLLAWFVIRPLMKKESDELTAAKVGNHFPNIKDKLVNILQLDKEKSTQLYSPELIDASFEDVRKEIEPLDFASVVSFAPAKRFGKILGAVAGVAALLLLAFPSLRDSAGRLWNYNQSFAAPLPFRFIVEPGNKEVVKGATVAITIRIEGEQQKQILLSSKPSGQIQFEERTLTPNASGAFTYEMPALKSTTMYKAHSGSVSSDEFTLTVLDRPMVKMMRLNLNFPSYSKLPSRQLDDNVGDVTALRGTRINFSIESNKELAEAKLVLSDSTSTQLKIENNKALGALPLMKERTYHIQLKDKESVASADPIEYTMKIVPDAYPTAQIIFPGTNIDIAENQRLNLLCKISDDFGFSKLRLAYKLIQSRYEQPWQEEKFTLIPIPSGIRNAMPVGRQESDVAYLWSLQEMNLVPEDVVSYYIEVFDNDNVSGPKSARSEVYTLRLPSLEEVFADVDKSHEMSIEGMKEALKQSEEAKKEIDELQQEMKKQAQQKMDWQQQKKAEEAMKKYDEIQKKMEEVNKTLDEMVKKLEKTETLSKETMEKYQELQQLMSEMNSPEFAEAMKKMQEAMMQMNPEQMKQAMQQFKFSEENFRNSIERTMNLLKRIQIEQKVDEMVQRTEEMMKKQEELQKQTEQTKPSDKNKLNDLAQQQKDLKEQLEQLQKELAELQKKMQEFPTEMPLSEMQKAQEQLEQSQLDEQMEQIAQQVQQQQMQQAQQNQQSARQKMQKFMQQMQQMQQAMRENQQRQIVNEMRRAMQDMLALSKRQEELKNQSQRLDPNSQQFRENAQQQMEIMRDLANITQGLSKLSQKTFAITPEMGKAIGDAMRQMNSAMQSLEQRAGQQAGGQQQGAMGSLNEAARQLQSAMQGMMQGGQGQGMGMSGFMQRLQQMSGQQQGINQGTQNMGGMTPQQQAEMGRLAAEQGMVRKSLEQLAKEAAQSGELSKMLGDLNRVAQDMREVQTDLAQGNVNPETIRKQERILSRLLDSQRSARERDFEKKRKAETGTNVARKSPGEIDLSTQEGRNRLRQDLQKAIEEGYAKDYQELIKKYYEALEREN
jgi:tetratricopeptide (TPR) repeat protein